MGKVWIAYDRTRERLPIAIADSAVGLAKITGAQVSCIRSTAHRIQTGEFEQGQFACVVVEDEE